MVNRVLIRLCSVTSRVTLPWALHPPPTFPNQYRKTRWEGLGGPQPLLEAKASPSRPCSQRDALRLLDKVPRHRPGAWGPFPPRGSPAPHYHGDISLEDLLDELVPGGVDQLDDVPVQGVPVLLQEACAATKSGHALRASAASA